MSRGFTVANTWFLPQTFRSLVDRVGLGSVVPVEFFGTGNFEFLPEDKSLQKFEVCWPLKHRACKPNCCYSARDLDSSTNLCWIYLLTFLCCCAITTFPLVFPSGVPSFSLLKTSATPLCWNSLPCWLPSPAGALTLSYRRSSERVSLPPQRHP